MYGETLPKPAPVLNQQAINDLDFALSQIPSAKVNGIGWDTAGKTGTWEYNNSSTENAHAWMVGYTKKIAAAVWVGNKKNEQSIKDSKGNVVWGSGIPSKIWQKFMGDATKAMNEEKKNTKWNPRSGVGQLDPPFSTPSPVAPDPQPDPNQTITPSTPPAGFIRPTRQN